MKKYEDDIIASVADTVRDVIEGKVKEEAKYPHDMFDPKTGEKEVAKDEAEHKALAKKGYTHDKPEVDEVAEPKAKGEKEFKGKHTVKKSGEKEDGSVVKEEVTISITEAKLKAGKGKAKIDIDHEGDDIKATEKKFKVKFKKTKDGFDLSGQKKDILAYLQSNEYDMDAEDIEDLFPELMEDVKAEEKIEEGFSKAQIKKAVETALKMGGDMTGAIKKIEKMKKGLSKDKEVSAALQLANEEVSEAVIEEAHAMNTLVEDKAKYKAFFNKALKKFGVKSPGELEGDKKKEFFDYVDAGYEADNEED
jgi:chorismate mutase